MILCKILIRGLGLLAFMAASGSLFAQAVPPLNQCRGQWVLTNLQEMNFGAFVAESGTSTITMDALGGLTASGLVSLSTSIPVTVWTIDVSNSLASSCATHGFDLVLPRPPAPLQGAGIDIPLGNIRLSVPAYGLNNVLFPQTIAPDPGNTAPFTVFIYGEISPTAPQTAGEYTRRLSMQFMQSVRRYRTRITVRATSIVPLAVTELAPMDFGTVAGGPVPGTVVLDVSNGRTATGDVQLLAAGPGTAATFEVTGEPNQAYSISFGSGTLANAGGQAMTVDSFTHNGSGTIPGSGLEQFRVGGRLNVGTNQAAGAYSTSNGGGAPYSVTINYN